MDRDDYRNVARRRLGIALGISAVGHLIAFGMVKLSVPVFESPEEGRALQVVELPDQWTKSAMEVVPLETARAGSGGAGATSARTRADRPGAGGDEATVAAIAPRSASPGTAPGTPALDLSIASATPSPAPLVETRPANVGVVRRPVRGIVRRTAGGASGQTGIDFVAASDAARDAERERGGDGWGGPGGIGVTIFGAPGDHSGHGHGPGEYCPPAAFPGVGSLGGLGGVPFGGKGRGIIGSRPPLPGGGGAINRVKPGRSR